MGIKCPECGSGADPTPDGSYAHCASCNNIFQPGKEGSSEKGTAHPDYEDKDKSKKDTKDTKDTKDEAKDEKKN